MVVMAELWFGSTLGHAPMGVVVDVHLGRQHRLHRG
jgi:hypothetical protein